MGCGDEAGGTDPQEARSEAMSTKTDNHYHQRCLRDALDALRALYDEQNGPPMLAPRHRKAWEEAMRRAAEILKKHGV